MRVSNRINPPSEQRGASISVVLGRILLHAAATPRSPVEGRICHSARSVRSDYGASLHLYADLYDL